MKKKILFLGAAIILIMAGIASYSLASGSSIFFTKWGQFLHDNNSNSSGTYRTFRNEYPDVKAESVNPEDVFAIGKDILITNTEINQAVEFYTLSGDNKDDSTTKAVSYAETYESLYLEAIKNGCSVTEDEVKGKVEELKELMDTAENKDEIKKVMDPFGSEEAYWEYEYKVYTKSLPIEKYRASLEETFADQSQYEQGSEEYLDAWNKWYDAYQKELVNKQEFQLTSELSEDQIQNMLKDFR